MTDYIGNFERVKFGTCTLRCGSGSPESSVTGSVGDVYVRTSTGGIYAKTSGAGNTGWSLLAASGGGALDDLSDVDVPSPSDGDVLTYDGSSPSGWVAQAPAGGGGGSGLSANDYLQYREEQTQNTTSGTFTSGAWRTRVLNTEVSDAGAHGALASNQITLAAGTYYARALAPAFSVDRNQLRLQNVTDAATLLLGISNHTSSAATTDHNVATLQGVFTIGASKAIELQHICSTTQSTRGFGVEGNLTTEVFATIEFWKLS